MPLPLRKPTPGKGGQYHVPSPADYEADEPAPRTTLGRLAASHPAVPDDSPHLIVEARAGTGKTTTLLEGLKYVLGGVSDLTPSPQQRAVWDCMALSAGKARTVAFVAFNKSIAGELQRRVPAGCEAMTMHSMGMKAVTRAFPGLRVNQYRVSDIVCELLGADPRTLRRTKAVVLRAVEQLVGLCKMNLTDATDGDALGKVASHYDVDLTDDRSGVSYRAEVFDLVPRVLDRCRDVTADRCMDFDDMVWLPVALDLPVVRYDLLLVDEAQDLNRCQQALAKKAGRRLILCGDPRQAIYGFAGADNESMKRMERELGREDCPDCKTGCVHCEKYGDGRGNLLGPACDLPRCVVLPLTVTRRCGKAIVEEARQIVPDFEAHESNGPGLVSRAKYPVQRDADGNEAGLPWEDTYAARVRDGDMVLCRVNAPLVSQCFRFLKRGRKAFIQGREVGAGLVKLIKKLNADTVPELIGKLSDWLYGEQAKENAKRNPDEARLIALQDKYDCLVCFCDGQGTPAGVIQRIDAVFTADPDAPGVRLSSIHRAKGLEADTVFLLEPDRCTVPHPMAKKAWQIESEWNLRYVAVTRARKEICYVS